jgi:hypothetical protein
MCWRKSKVLFNIYSWHLFSFLKGGFGSLLRAFGKQITKSTNRDACRDLSGISGN